jgi:hypothetical protein
MMMREDNKNVFLWSGLNLNIEDFCTPNSKAFHSENDGSYHLIGILKWG